ncbi:MAG: ABC transporter ATP-binding protein [Saprospiraceae bacterium]|nr:ABC transporter ATP-binding protein [Bacteroidia bacterium]NNE13775.1 ABC transporter ATP-binding protein [Saprospiraceae bacterium]NNL90681.1 ABC transporter ATP-binding protein [Saprospiraceae bacterium]
MEDILNIVSAGKKYKSGDRELDVLKDINFDIKLGDIISIVGPSGSGKTTLLGLCAGLDNPSSGKITLCGKVINDLTEDERSTLRNENVGFIFQNFQLIPTLTALENVMIPLELLNNKNARQIATDLLERVGLGERMTHYPSQLSGGEQQRVSIARAFSNTPKILFADEPTGNLDDVTGDKIESLLFELNKEHHTTLVLVTHDLELANKTNRIIKLKGGKVISDNAVNL